MSQRLLLVYGVLNVVLYALLLPLWEGFDEPFHYGYVQSLSVERRLPVSGRATLSDEIAASLALAPGSHIVRRNIPAVRTFAGQFALEPGERRARRAALEALDPRLALAASGQYANYEAHQAPLAYIALGLPDAMLRSVPLLPRVCALRIVAGLAALAALWVGVSLLCRELAVPPFYRGLALFTILSCQMFYATAVHIANDWLAVPLFVLSVALMRRAARTGSARDAAAFGIALGAGLLTKAYFLALVPIVAVMALWGVRRRIPLWPAALALAIGAPWYARNILLYGNLTGMNEASLPFSEVTRAAAALDWPGSLGFMARGALWTGNNSFTTFSRLTLDAMLALLALGAACYFVRGAARTWTALSAAVFFAAILYSTALSYAFTKGASAGASPWYLQPLFCLAAVLASAGYARIGGPGRALALLLCALSAWVVAATYVAKLIPQYGGFGGRPSRAAGLFHWYTGELRAEALAATIPGPPAAVAALTLAVAGTAAILLMQASRSLTRKSTSKSSSPSAQSSQPSSIPR